MIASYAGTCSVTSLQSMNFNFNTWTKLHKDGEVRALKLEYAMQQHASIQYPTTSVIKYILYTHTLFSLNKF
jgi:hypothetical protein